MLETLEIALDFNKKNTDKLYRLFGVEFHSERYFYYRSNCCFKKVTLHCTVQYTLLLPRTFVDELN